jgi:hypothetical protein
MKLRARVTILFVAVLLTFVGFSLIASPAVDVIKVGNKAGYEIISNYLAKSDAVSHQSSIEG